MVVKMVVRPIAKLSEETRRNERPSYRSSMLRRRTSDHSWQRSWCSRRTAMLFLDATFKAHLKLDQLLDGSRASDDASRCGHRLMEIAQPKVGGRS
jgi:hypothetical protein